MVPRLPQLILLSALIVPRSSFLLGSGFSEKMLQQRGAFIAENAFGNLSVMIQRWLLQQIQQPTTRPAFGVAASKNDPSNSAMNNCAGTHRAGLFGNVKVAIGQPPITHRRLSLGQRKHFRMSRRVFEGFHLIAGSGDNRTIVDDDRANGNFFGKIRMLSLAQSLGHHELIAVKIDYRAIDIVVLWNFGHIRLAKVRIER